MWDFLYLLSKLSGLFNRLGSVLYPYLNYINAQEFQQNNARWCIYHEDELKDKVIRTSLIQQLDDDDKQTIFKLIDKILASKKFEDFFNKNVVAF